jgi:hypothetical protein
MSDRKGGRRENTSPVRLKRTTIESLRKLGTRMANDYYEGKSSYPVPGENGVTLDAVIVALVERSDAHRARAAKQRGKRAAAKAAGPGEAAGQ